jgi:hypothetical protein
MKDLRAMPALGGQRVSLKRCLILYMGLPVLLAFINGMRGTAWAPELGASKSILMFLVCGLLTYGFAALVAHLFLKFTVALRAHPVIALICSAVIAVPFSYFVVMAFIKLFGDFYPSLQPLVSENSLRMGDGFLLYLVGPTAVLIVPLWIGAQYIYEAVSKDVLFFEGFIKYEHGPEPEPDVQDTVAHPNSSPFLNKIKPSLGSNILVLEAQEHYVKVYTERGDDLVLYRLGDAVQELSQAQTGFRIHRSYWVAEDAISQIMPSGKTYKILLKNGLDVPVSKPYKKVIDNLLLQKPNFQNLSGPNP